MKKTQLDLYISAHNAAVNALKSANSYQVENTMLEAFTADGNDPADFDFWKAQFAQRFQAMASMKAQPAPSAKAAPTPSTINK